MIKLYYGPSVGTCNTNNEHKLQKSILFNHTMFMNTLTSQFFLVFEMLQLQTNTLYVSLVTS